MNYGFVLLTCIMGGGCQCGIFSAEECTVPYVLAYDDLLSGPFKTFFDCSQKIGGDVATIAKLVQECFINQRAFLVMASKSQRPLDTELPQVPLSLLLLLSPRDVRVDSSRGRCN